jgi:RNA polymerase sigma-70 factor, ECF subfamily
MSVKGGAASQGTPETTPPIGVLLSFEVLFESYAPFVWRALSRLGVAPPDLPDVSQEVFLTAHRMLPTFEQRCAATTWLYGISVRVAATHRRQLLRRREKVTSEFPEEDSERLSGNAEVNLYRERLERVLYDLPLGQAEVFILYELEELTMSEVAAALGYPLQTAYSRLYAARKAVLAAFGEKIRSSGT